MSRDISTDLNILARPAEWEQLSTTLPALLGKSGYDVDSVHGEIVDLTCEPDNMLVAQFAREQGRMPTTEVLYRVIINGQSGKVAGKKPVSWVRVLIAIAVVGAIIAGIILLTGGKGK